MSEENFDKMPEEMEAEDFLSSDDDPEDDEDLNEQEVKEIEKLKQTISENPYDYQSYISLIDLLSRAGELMDLRNVRSTFSKYYPLTPDIWLAWIKDEQKISTSDGELEHVQELFDRASKDYTSVKVWLERCLFSLSQKNAGNGQKIRETFEEAIVHVGVHTSQGSLIWDAYREFENSLLMMSTNKTDQEQCKNRIEKLFQRQLKVPLLNMEATFEEFKNWQKTEMNFGAAVNSNIQREYDLAREHLKKCEVFEDKMIQNQNNNQQEELSLQIYSEYLELELKGGNPARIRTLYERRITDHCLYANCWLEYSDYLEKSMKMIDQANEVLSRSVRNCPWSGILWVKLLRSCEKLSLPLEVVRGHVESALASENTSIYRDVWIAFIDYRRRGMKLDDEDDDTKREAEIEELRKLFSKALEQLAQVAGDPDCKIARYWASVEADRFQSMDKARQIWSDIVSKDSPAGDYAKFWIEYINLEKLFGDTKHLKKLFPRAVERTKDWPEQVGELWIQFEREEGDLESFEESEVKVNARIKVIEAQRANVQQEKDAKIAMKKEKDKDKRREKRHQESNERKRKLNIVEHGEGAQPPPMFKKPFLGATKNSNTSPPKSETPAPTSSMPSSDTTSTSMAPPPGFKTPNVAPPPGYKRATIKEIPAAPPGYNNKASSSSGDTGSQQAPPDTDVNNERTVFLSNLSFTIEKSTIQQVFAECGEIVDIRLPSNAGKLKGFGYVEFKTIQAAIKALQMDNEKIDNRPMFVSVCDPDKKSKGHQFQYSTTMEKNKLFVKGLAKSVNENDLKQIFGKFGTITAVRMPTLRNGHPKGMAYIEYENESSTKKAILELDNSEIKGQKIFVAISDPPKRKESSAAPSEAPSRSLGGGSNTEPLGPRGRGRSNLSFVPRSVQKSNVNNTNGGSNNGATNGQKNMSNTDFRNMLLSKKE